MKIVSIVLSSALFMGAPMLASANWTADIRLNYAITSDVGGTDQDIGDDSEIVTFNGDGIEGSSGFGFSVGKRFDNMGVSLAYESMGVTYDLSGSVQANGTVQLPGTDSDYDVDTFMLEIDYTGQINEAFDWNVLAGIGQTTFDFGANGVTVPQADGTNFLTGETSDNSDTSMRIGAGVSYKLSETATLLTMLQYTNYGTADLKIGTGANQTTLTMDVEATELSMRVRFDF